MKIYNEFGITPTNTYVSAGSDYYIPNIDDFNFTQAQNALKAFEKLDNSLKFLKILMKLIKLLI